MHIEIRIQYGNLLFACTAEHHAAPIRQHFKKMIGILPHPVRGTHAACLVLAHLCDGARTFGRGGMPNSPRTLVASKSGACVIRVDADLLHLQVLRLSSCLCDLMEQAWGHWTTCACAVSAAHAIDIDVHTCSTSEIATHLRLLMLLLSGMPYSNSTFASP